MTQYDPVSLKILWDRLVSIADELVLSLVRTSFSMNVREGYDLSCMIFDARAHLVAQGSYSVPSFTGTAPQTIAHMLRAFPANTLKPGDVIATNDPWMGTGHLFDINVMRPVFRGDRLTGFTMSVTHLPDIGGKGMASDCTEVYHEGLRLPVCKLSDGGQLNELLLEIALMGQRTEFAAKGLQGGDGALRRYEVNGQPVDPKSRVELSPGDRISMREAGGGGFGSAAERRS